MTVSLATEKSFFTGTTSDLKLVRSELKLINQSHSNLMENQNICIATMAIPLADKNPTLLVLILSSNLYGFFRFLIFYYSEPKAKATDSEGHLCVLYCKVKSWRISQGLQDGHESSEIKVFSQKVLRNVISQNKNLLIAKSSLNLQVACSKPFISMLLQTKSNV